MKILQLLPFWLLAYVFLLPSHSWALPSFQRPLKDQEIDLTAQGVSYLGRPNTQISDQKTGKVGAKVGARFSLDPEANFLGAIEGEGLYGLGNSNYRYLDISEGFLGWNFGTTKVYLGRKKFTWNAMDEYWPLGLFQPRFRWDYLNERQEGLFGAFLNFKPNDYLEVTAYGSPIFIPESGAPFQMANGQCTSNSPWFYCPSSTLMLFNQPTSLQFNLAVPSIASIISHPGYGTSVRLGKLENTYVRLSWVHKPMNQLVLGYEGQLDTSTLTLPATIHPRVLYHYAYAADLGTTIARSQLVASFIAERPIRDYTPPTWNTQEVSNANLVGVTWKNPVFWDSEGKTRYEVSYFHREGGVSPDRGPFVPQGTSIFEPRYGFRNAYNFAFFTPLVNSWSDTFQLSTRFVWDTVYNGNVLIVDAFVSPWKQVRLDLGLDLLGSDNHTRADFISRYQTNDRIRGSATYVF